MKRLNKCRTIAKFDEKVLAMVTGQTASTSSETQKTSTTNQKSENESDKKTESENKTQAQPHYLLFDADEFIITTTKTESGWWYGYKDIGNVQGQEIKIGFFPSNYVQVVEEYKDEEIPPPEPEETKNEAKDEEFGGFKVDWSSYASSNFMNESQLALENRMKSMQDPNADQNRNPDGVLRYKKVKIHESRSHAVNPWKGGQVKTIQIAVKDQTAVGKAYRQMHHYFDYDKWIEERNKNPPPKAKADITKKKKKKMPEWLKKLGEDRDDDY